MRVVVHQAASAEVSHAASWYEARQAGLGREFVDEVDRGLAAITESPERWPAWSGVPSFLRVRRFLLTRFPYAIAYRTHEQQITVVAVAHLRRSPGYWRSRAG